MYAGIADRLQSEISSLAPSDLEVKIIAPDNRKISAWKGGSTFGSLSTFEENSVTKADYEEHGAKIVHRKCP